MMDPPTRLLLICSMLAACSDGPAEMSTERLLRLTEDSVPIEATTVRGDTAMWLMRTASYRAKYQGIPVATTRPSHIFVGVEIEHRWLLVLAPIDHEGECSDSGKALGGHAQRFEQHCPPIGDYARPTADRVLRQPGTHSVRVSSGCCVLGGRVGRPVFLPITLRPVPYKGQAIVVSVCE